MKPIQIISPLLALIAPALAQAAEFNAAELSLAWGIPFALILLSIALGPLFFANIWHHHFGKITLGWTLLFLIPFTFTYLAAARLVHHLGRHPRVGQFARLRQAQHPSARHRHRPCLHHGHHRRSHADDTPAAQSQRQPQA